MFDPWIDAARALLSSNLVVPAMVVCGGVIAFASVAQLGETNRRNAGRSRLGRRPLFRPGGRW